MTQVTSVVLRNVGKVTAEKTSLQTTAENQIVRCPVHYLSGTFWIQCLSLALTPLCW